MHIPKGAPVDGELPASKLRPITVLSTWYRLLGSCWLRSTEVRQWLQGWWPPQAVGGKKGSGVHEALINLADSAIHDEHYMISLDFSLAFDILDPALAGMLLRQAGMPGGLVSLLQSVWCDQHRILQYDGQAYHRSVQVTTSLPQGDGWSLIAMVLRLAGPTKDIQSLHPGLLMKTFIDDRTFTTGSADEVLQVKGEWASWSQARTTVKPPFTMLVQMGGGH